VSRYGKIQIFLREWLEKKYERVCDDAKDTLMYRNGDKSKSSVVRRAVRLLPLFFGTFAFGTLGLHLTDGLTYFESFYMTVITVSTVGFGEIQPLSIHGRVVVIFIIMFGMTIVAYTLSIFIRLAIEGELSRSLGRRRLEKSINSMKDHFIICGYGRIGRLIARELRENGIPFVVIENAPPLEETLRNDGVCHLSMDATTEEALIDAGIMRAKAIVTAVQSDSDNVFITLTARSLNADIFILARGSDERNESKLRRAGASRVALPYQIGGKRMAQMLVRPTVVDFLDVAMMDSDLGLQMEELRVTDGSFADGKNLIESNIRRTFGVIIVAVKKQNGGMLFNPAAEELLEKGDILVVLGKKDDLARLGKKI
jgi:voltage-gated potassium channel